MVARAVPGSRFFGLQAGIPLGRTRSGPPSHIGSHLADPVDPVDRTERRVFAGHTLGILGTVLADHSFLAGRCTAADRRTETYCLFR